MVAPLSQDTAPEIERLQVEGWRRMSADQKAESIRSLTAAVLELAAAGIRHRHPADPPEVQRARLAALLHGPSVAHQLFPHVDLKP